MTQPFPQTEAYSGFLKPCRFEADIDDLEVEGALPDIAGAFFRVGPDPHFPPRMGDDIFFNGDGMATRFLFGDGKVALRQRYIRTDKFVAEEQAGRALFGAYRNPFTDDPSVAGMIRGTANTNIVWHGGKLLALKEDSPPVAMDPWTMETHGNWTFDGALTSRTFTAHPHIDPDTGEMLCFGYAATGEATDDVAYYVVDRHGKVIHETWFKVPYSGMLHDFGVSKNYVVFPVVPITSSIEYLKAGRPHFLWDPSKDVWLGVLPRYGTARELRWFRMPCRYSTHVFNAFDDGDKIYIDTPTGKGNPFPFFPDINGAPFDLHASAPHIQRWTIDLSSNSDAFTETMLCDIICEFPRIDDRYKTHAHRHGWIGSFDYMKPWTAERAERPMMMFNSITHFDFAQNAMKRWFIGDTSTLEEVQFVPRRRDAAEGDGFILAIVNRHHEMRSDLVILDAQHVEEGPIATVKVPFRIRNGLHGNWIDRADLPEHA